MKIGLLSPWTFAAETQAIAQIIQVAKSQGHDAVECKSTPDVLREAPDFVLAMSLWQPKLTSVPTYGLLYTPCRVVAENAGLLQAVLSYDGYFTISDRQHAFMSDLLFACRREDDIGYFYTTSMTAVWSHPIAFATARLAYFGSNWDARHSDLFHRLVAHPWLEIYGPEETWSFLDSAAYKGSVPFDGRSVLERYRAAGAGLVLLSRMHLADDLITMRVFEISAAGAVAIAPAIPWLERNFGDALLYVDQEAGADDLARQVVAHVDWIRGHPEAAAAKARRAQEIFTERFSYEALLPNVIAYHAARSRRAVEDGDGSLVSVIVRTGGRPASILRRAVTSLTAQWHRRLELVLVVDTTLDPTASLADLESRFERIEIIATPGAAGSKALATGLSSCTGDYIALLDADGEWLPEHLSELIRAVRRSGDGRVAFSGVIEHCRESFPTVESKWQLGEPFLTTETNREVRRLTPWPMGKSPGGIFDRAAEIAPSAFLFPRALLDGWMLQDPRLSSAEHTHLILSLLEKAAPVFTYRATVLVHLTDEASEGGAGHARAQDLARLRLRFFGRSLAPAPHLVGVDDLRDLDLGDGGGPPPPASTLGLRRRFGITEYPVPAPVGAMLDAEADWRPTPLEIDQGRLGLSGETKSASTESVFPLTVRPPAGAWQYGLVLPIEFPEDRAYVVRLHGRVESGEAGFGVLCRNQDRFTYRVFVAERTDELIIDLPVPDPSDAGPIVVTASAGAEPVRVLLKSVQLLAAGPRLHP